MAQVEIQAEPHRFVFLLSREAADELGLEPGMLAAAAIKATNISVEIPAADRQDRSEPPARRENRAPRSYGDRRMGAARSVSGSEAKPLRVLLRRRRGSPARASDSTWLASAVSRTSPSSRANAAPTQAWIP
jgi:TOBE domain